LARRAAERYLADLAAHNPRARQESTAPAPSASFVGGTVLRVDPPVSVAERTLRMEAGAAREQADRAALELGSSGEESADSLWLRSDAASRRERVLRAALAAAAGVTPETTVRVCRMLVRTRWGGPLVGPERVDREYVLRAASARGGRWIVFSLLPRDRDPSGLPF
jgi:hypothetical protein